MEANNMAKTGIEQANEMINDKANSVDETLEQYKTRLGRHPTEDEYKVWLKPKIARDVQNYKSQGLDEKTALDELMDAYGYEDLVKESYYGRPKRSDIQVWKDRASKYAKDVGDMWPFAKNLTNLNDDDVQEMIDLFGFNRNGEW